MKPDDKSLIEDTLSSSGEAKKEIKKELIIDPELKVLIPTMADDERKLLEESIISKGCLSPVIVWKEQNILLDGLNREEICRKHGIKFDTVELEFETRDQVIAWIINNQLGRRNLPPIQRIDLVMKLEDLYVAMGKKKMSMGGKRDPLVNLPKHDTRKIMSRMARVSPTTYAQAKKVLKEGNEAEINELRNGERAINGVFLDIVKRSRNASIESADDVHGNQLETPEGIEKSAVEGILRQIGSGIAKLVSHSLKDDLLAEHTLVLGAINGFQKQLADLKQKLETHEESNA